MSPTHPAARPPGPNAPKLWQLFRTQRNFVGYLDSCAASFGSTFTLRVYPYGDIVVATEPRDLETIYRHLPERFVPGMAPALVLGPILGQHSVFMATGSEHRRQRRLIRPALRGDLVSRWAQRMSDLAVAELEQLPTGVPVEMRQPMRDITLDVICRLVFGIDDPDRYRALRDDISRGVGRRLGLLLWFPTLWYRNGRLNPLRDLRERRQMLLRMLAQQIESHRSDPDLASRDDALALLLQAHDDAGNTLENDELCEQLLTLLAAGNESTAVALAWACERLSRNPLALAKLVGELDRGEETYLQAVVKETLRLRPPVLDATRTATEDIELGGYPIAKGTMVIAAFTVTHRRSDLWPDPEAFRPDRFLDSSHPKYSYTPFGGGVRRCIGSSLGELEMQIVLKELLSRFTLAPALNTEEWMRLEGLTLVPSDGAKVVLHKRSPSYY